MREELIFHQEKEPETEPTKYEFFPYEAERRDIFNYSKAIAEYLRSENIPNLVIIDRSSRPLYIGVMEYLRNKYPDEKMPNINFMNPKGFKAREDLTPNDIQEIIADCDWKGDISEPSHKVRSQDDILKEFGETYKNLMEDKDKPVLVFDTCLHTGNTISPVKKTLELSGFSDVRIGTITPTREGSKVSSDFYITTRRPENGCYPFDRDRMIEKTFDHVYSRRTDDTEKRNRSIKLREEIKKIMEGFLAR